MTKVIRGLHSLISPKTHFWMFVSSKSWYDAMKKYENSIISILDDLRKNSGFSITLFLNDGRKLRYVGFTAYDGYRIAYFYNNVPYGHFDEDTYSMFIDEICGYAKNGLDLYVKAV